MARFRFSSSRPLNERGFSLMEIMLVCGLVGITSLAIVSLMENVNTQMTGARNKTDAASVVMAVQAAMKNPDSCKYTLLNSGANTSTGKYTLTHIGYYSDTGGVTAMVLPAAAGSGPIDVPGSSFLQVKSMKMTKPANASLPPVLLAGGTGVWAADLVITFQQKNNLNVSMKPYVISGLLMQTNSSGVVTSCKLGLTESCVTGYELMNTSPQISSGDAAFTGTANDVFQDETDSSNWGMSCKTGWKMTGCSASALKPITSVTTMNANGGKCLAAKIANSMTAGVSRVYLTCCSQ